MALWKDDGLRLVKGDRIEIEPGVWDVRKAEWIRAYKERKSRDGLSVVQTIDEDSEWCAEAYLRPDYSQITERSLESALRKYALYCLSVSEQGADLSEEASDA